MTEGDVAPSPARVDPPGVEATEREWRRRRALALLVPLAIVALAGFLRFYRLGEPPDIYFDETYYVTDARSLLDVGTEEGFAVHPPLGKWLLAGGMVLAGDGPVGWRLAVAAAGTLTVLVTYLAGRRLFDSQGLAALAALLVAADGLAFTMSRIAMLDALLTLFVVTGLWLLLIDRDRQWATVGPPSGEGAGSEVLPRVRHPYRWLAGVALGIGLAVKLSALLAIGAAGLFVAVSELAWRRRATGSPWRRIWAPALGTIAALLVVPAAIYVASHAGWFANFPDTRLGQERCPGEACPTSAVELVDTWIEEQRTIVGFHRDLQAPHPYRSQAGEWLWLRRPVAYHYTACPTASEDCAVPVGTVSHVLAVGNPVLWWLGLVVYPALAWLGAARRDWRALALLAFLAAQYVPWLVARRPLFLFYLTPFVPFLALGLAHVSGVLAQRPRLRWVPWVVAAAAVVVFAFLYPVLAALPISPEAWQRRMLLDSWV